MVPSRFSGIPGEAGFLFVAEEVETGTGNCHQEEAMQVSSLLAASDQHEQVACSPFPVSCLREADMVSDVAGRWSAGAARDRAVVRAGDGSAAGAPNLDARPSLLALLLT